MQGYKYQTAFLLVDKNNNNIDINTCLAVKVA